MIDIGPELITLLLTDAPLGVLISTRIYTPKLPDSYFKDAGRDPDGFLEKALVFVIEGGDEQGNKTLGDVEIGFACYGSSAIESRQVYRALRDFLHGLGHRALGAGRLMYAQAEDFGTDLMDMSVNELYFVDAPYTLTIKGLNAA